MNTKKFFMGVAVAVTVFASSSVFASCERGNPNNAETLQTVKYNLSMYFKDKSLRANKSLSNTDACLLAESVADSINSNLSTFAFIGNTLLDTTKLQYSKTFAGTYYKGLQGIISSAVLSFSSTQKESAKVKAKLLWDVVKYQNSTNVDKYNFQLYVVAPFLYNYNENGSYIYRDIVEDTKRFSSKGKEIKGCGKLICESEKVSIFDWLLY